MASPVAKTFKAATGFLMACGRANSQAGSTITVNDHLDQKVFQRVVGAKSVPVTGSYTGSPSVIEARAVDFTSGAAITAWTPIVIYPTGGTYNGLLRVPQGCWYRLQVRDGVNTTITAQGLNKLGVGIIVVLSGQSNMANFLTTPFHYPSGGPRSVEWRGSVFNRLGNINDNFPPSTKVLSAGPGGYPDHPNSVPGSSRADGYVYFANTLSTTFNVPVLMVEISSGGTSIQAWMQGQAFWTSVVNRINQVGGDFEVFQWLQGESDANTMSTATMKLRLTDLHNQLKALRVTNGHTASAMTFFLTSLGVGNSGGSSEGEFGNIRAAHIQFASETQGAFISACAHDTRTGADAVHIDGLGHAHIGRREGKTIASVMGFGVSGAGPKIIGATRSGTAVTVQLKHSGGTALLDGDGGSGAALTGFQFFDGVTPLPYVSSAIVGNTVAIALQSAPVGVLTMSYAMSDVPYGTLPNSDNVKASILYDNATYIHSTTGCPCQPLAPITVTSL